jgi:hypothetical protein
MAPTEFFKTNVLELDPPLRRDANPDSIDDEDEAMAQLAEELGKLVDHVGGPKHTVKLLVSAQAPPFLGPRTVALPSSSRLACAYLPVFLRSRPWKN